MPRGFLSSGSAYGTRKGSVEIVHTFPFSFDTPGIAAGVIWDRIAASASNPVQIEMSLCLVTTFNASGADTITAAATGDLAVKNTSSNGGAAPTYYNPVFTRLTEDTNLSAQYIGAGTPATAGAAVMIVKEYRENTLSP